MSAAHSVRKPIIILILILSVSACVRSNPETIVITATFAPETATAVAQILSEQSLQPSIVTSNPQQAMPTLGAGDVPQPEPTEIPNIQIAQEYVVQSGDTLTGIAVRFGVSLDTMQAINQLENPDQLSIGQVLLLPEPPTEVGSDFRILPDSRLVRAPGSRTFDIYGFVAQQSGYVRSATDTVEDVELTAAQVVERVSLEYSVDARLLLALLEFKGTWLSQSEVDDYAQVYPLGAQASAFGFDRNGLYRQLAWAAEQLNAGYYGWKLRGLSAIEFADGIRIRLADTLNAGTIGVQYVLSQFNDYFTWREQVSAGGLFNVYVRYFGDPFIGAVEPLVPPTLTQPNFTLPFQQGETWLYTGGPHGGYGTGSAWAAVDFAPPDERADDSPLCYISDFFATAVAPGIIARSNDGTVILDLDGDGDESTGWTVVYLHIGTLDRIGQGSMVSVGDRIGRPSCEGGFSSATHLHVGRRFNGEWIPTTCDGCSTTYSYPPFVMGGWEMVGFANQEYQGYMTLGNERRIAEQGRLIAENRVSW
jgi:LysM repeat protein